MYNGYLFSFVYPQKKNEQDLELSLASFSLAPTQESFQK